MDIKKESLKNFSALFSEHLKELEAKIIEVIKDDKEEAKKESTKTKKILDEIEEIEEIEEIDATEIIKDPTKGFEENIFKVLLALIMIGQLEDGKNYKLRLIFNKDSKKQTVQVENLSLSLLAEE
jgi:hypothetical protein